MTNVMLDTTPVARGTDVPRGIGLTGRVAVSWAVAGGVLLGGFLVALLTLTQKMSANGLLVSSTVLFTVGGLAGFIHGGALGYFGRGPETTRKQAVAGLSLAALYTIPFMAAGWVATGWIAMTVMSLYTGTITAYAGMVLGWAAGAVAVVMAVVLGWQALRQAYGRWQDAAIGTGLVAASFAGLLIMFLARHPTLWGLGLQVTEPGAIIAALMIAIWIVGPTVTLALAVLRRVPVINLSLGVKGRGGPIASIAIGLVVGVVTGLVALPFHLPPMAVPVAATGTGALGSVVVAVAHALVNEVLLRLVLMTGTIWLLLRWHPMHREEAAILAVVVSTVAQLALYLPGILAIGFPSTLAALGYTLLAVVVPGIVFGAVYYTRGFTTAVLADATALVALALLA